jgi:hypothetical protein
MKFQKKNEIGGKFWEGGGEKIKLQKNWDQGLLGQGKGKEKSQPKMA